MNGPKNQSKEHAELATRSLRWLASRSTGRGIVGATEIEVMQGYIADAVALAGFQLRFLERYTINSEAIRPRIQEFACVFEVKVSVPDFNSTFGTTDKHANRHKPVGSLHWCVTPKNMVAPSLLPEFWGLLEASGQGLREVRMPRACVVSRPTIHKIAYQILWYGRRRHANYS